MTETYTSPVALLLLAIESLLMDETTLKPRFGLHCIEIGMADVRPPAFPAAILVPGVTQETETQEATHSLAVALVSRAVKSRTGVLGLADLAYTIKTEILDHSTELADGWDVSAELDIDPQLIGRAGADNDKGGKDLIYVAVINLTARRLE
jgi:hypothetical protein